MSPKVQKLAEELAELTDRIADLTGDEYGELCETIENTFTENGRKAPGFSHGDIRP